MSQIKQQRGYILLPVVLLITLVATVAFMLNNQSVLDSGITHSKAESEQAEYVGQAGLNHALWQVEQAGCGPYNDISSEPLGVNSYSATITPNNAGGAVNTYTVAVSDDAFIKSDAPTQNYGSDAQLYTFANITFSEIRRTLYRFDIASAGIPAGGLVVSAVARIFVVDSNTFGSIGVHRITADWTEATVHWDNINADHDASLEATIPAGSPAGQYVDVNITPLVQGWINGSIDNQGIMLKTSIVDEIAQYTSKEYGNVNQRPELVIKVADGSLSNRADINATGALANGVTRTVTRADITLVQPPSSVVWQPGAELEDAFIWDGAHTNKNFGISPILNIKNDSNVLIRFALEALPPGARITDARLELYLEGGAGVVDGVLDLHAISRSWVEGIYDDVNPATGDGVTYQEYNGGNNWATPGGDYDPTVIDSVTLPTMVPGWYEWNVTEQIQSWLDGAPNYGFLLREGGGDAGDIDFTSSDNTATPENRPRLTLTFACECGVACQIPQGSGNILFVVTDDWNLTAAEIRKKSLFESWGYVVDMIAQWDVSWNFNNKAVNNDVVYVSKDVNAGQAGMAPVLAATSLGLINEKGQLNDDLGIANNFGKPVGTDINVTDNSHYITQLFPSGILPIFTKSMTGMTTASGDAAGLQVLAEFGGATSLAVLDSGAPLQGGGTAPGRRAVLPIGKYPNDFNLDYLNNNGRLIVQRALQWGTGNTAATPAGNLLLVVVNPGSLTAQEAAKKTLIESWGYAVNLIDEADSQASYDTALAANDVVFITEDVNASTVGTKLVNATIGVVTEEDNLSDEFGLSDSINWGSGTVLKIEGTHYITETLPPGNLTILTVTESLADLTGSLAPALQIHGVSTDGPALVSVEAGADVIAGRTAAGRRVQLPWGGNNFDVNHLNADGMTIMKRAIEWGMGAGAAAMGPIAHWKLDDGTGTTAIDSEGGHDGTLSPSGPVWVAGQLGDALDFDGSDDYVDLTSDAELDDVFVGGATVMAWINPASWGNNGYGRIFDKSSSPSSTGDGWAIRVNKDNDGLNFGQGFTGGRGWWRFAESSIDLDTNTWQHIALSYDASSTANDPIVYLNGSPVAVTRVDTPSGSLRSDAAINLHLGNHASSAATFFEGKIDDARIYDSMLSAAEIAAAATPPPPGPIAHWMLDETSGTTAVDSVGGHDGTLTNGPSWDTGQVDGALNFDGSNDYVNVPHDSSLNLASALTISTWFRADSFGVGIGGYRTFVSKYPNATTANYWFGTWKQELVFGFWSGGVWQEVFPTGLGLSTGQWYQAAVTFDDVSDQVLLYLDGTLVHTGVMTLTPPVNTGAVTIGRSAAGEYWDGQLDDIRIYDKVLTGADIAALAGGGSGGGGGDPDPGSCDGTFRDEFNAVSFSNNDGTLNWMGDWLEVGESDGPGSNDVRVRDDNGSYQLWLRDKQNGGEGVEREADLSGAVAATLSFEFRRSGLDRTSDYVKLEISSNGAAGPWIELARFQGSATDTAYQSFSQDISAYISAATRIRLITSPTMGSTDTVMFDNIQILCSP